MGEIFVEIFNSDEKTINIEAALFHATQPPNGAETMFIGTVRNLNQGKQVLGVSYDVFEPLAKQSFLEICQEAQKKWGKDLDLYVVHSRGRLNIGGVSIVIGVGSPHRDEGFKACRYIIEQIKHRSPIWKLEHYVDGDSEWTKGCELCEHSHQVPEHSHG